MKKTLLAAVVAGCAAFSGAALADDGQVKFIGDIIDAGCDVVLVSSRDQVLPGEDSDAAGVLQAVFERKGMEIYSRSRAVAARREALAAEVGLAGFPHAVLFSTDCYKQCGARYQAPGLPPTAADSCHATLAP